MDVDKGVAVGEAGHGECGSGAERDAQLLTQVRAGEMGAFGELYRAHVIAAYRYAVSCGASAADRDDLVSMTFTDVLQAILNGGGPATEFRPYLFVSLRRHAARLARQYWQSQSMPEVPDAAVESPEVAVLRAQEHQCAVAALMALPERWRHVIWRTAVDGCTYAEVATELGISEGAARSLAHRARQALRIAPHCGQRSEPAGQCQEVRLLRDYLSGALPRQRTAAVRQHLAQCAVCSQALADLRQQCIGQESA